MNDDEVMTNSERTAHILIIDDEKVDREIYKRFLSKIDEIQFTVDEADNAKTGLKKITNARPDCILLDQNLPDMQGLDFVNQLTYDFPDHSIPIIILTGQGSEEVAAGAIRIDNIVNYLIKGDINESLLKNAILSAVDKKNDSEKISVSKEVENACDKINKNVNYLLNESHSFSDVQRDCIAGIKKHFLIIENFIKNIFEKNQ